MKFSRGTRSTSSSNHLRVNEIDERAVFSAAYGVHFAIELRERRGRGAVLNVEPLASVAHDAVTVARGAVQGLRAIGQLEKPEQQPDDAPF